MTPLETAATSAIASAATKAIFDAAIARVSRTITGPAKAAAVKALASLQGYESYLQETNDRVSTFKTFADPTKPVDLLSHFVSTTFKNRDGSRTFDQDDLINRIKRPSRLVISATAGFGKSMVMRYIALSLFHNPNGKIPLFLELRNLNRVQSPDITTFIHSSYKAQSDAKIEALKKGIMSGAFVLILDGFDELNHDIRPLIEDQILALARENPKVSIIVSGRPDDRFYSWRQFSVFKIEPMLKKQVIKLIDNLEYDAGVRRRFISAIKNGLYESHESFLSTPLLAILMLLTFEQNANIPDKMYLFYGEAFKALFHKHDALKEQYNRSRKSGLAVDDFEKVFSVFCLKTYVQEKTEFTRAEIIGSITDAIVYERQTVSNEDFLFDIEEAVCLIMREGPSYFFVHRSFQEYFTAVFLANCAQSIRDDFISKVSVRHWDNVLPMLFDMASSQIEPTWVAENCETYLSKVGLSTDKMHPFISRFERIEFFQEQGRVHVYSFKLGDFSRFISVMSRFYKSIKMNEPVISFKALEDWAKKNWNQLAERFSERRFSSNSDAIVLSIPVSDIPDDVIEASNLRNVALSEYEAVNRIYNGLDREQQSRQEFLDKLFSERTR